MKLCFLLEGQITYLKTVLHGFETEVSTCFSPQSGTILTFCLKSKQIHSYTFSIIKESHR